MFLFERNLSQIEENLGLIYIYYILGGGSKYFLFSPLFGEDSHFD